MSDTWKFYWVIKSLKHFMCAFLALYSFGTCPLIHFLLSFQDGDADLAYLLSLQVANPHDIVLFTKAAKKRAAADGLILFPTQTLLNLYLVINFPIVQKL